MTGIFFFLILYLWVSTCIRVFSEFRKKATTKKARYINNLVFAFIILFPVLDEVIGAIQFTYICDTRAVLHINEAKIAGKRVYVEINPSHKRMNTAIPIYRTKQVYRDELTHEVLASFERFEARGGWLIRMLGISESNSPIIIPQPYCSPEKGVAISTTYNFTVLN